MFLLFVLLLIVAAPVKADSVYSKERQVTQLADGVYTIRHIDPIPGWVNGNTTVIIGAKEVFVVDSCQIPSAAREDIAQIRKWTDKPVRYLLNTHWHGDHSGGNSEYAKEFPGIAIVAHAETKTMMDMASPNLAASWSKDANNSREALTRILDSGKSSSGKPLTDEQKDRIHSQLTMLDGFEEVAKTFQYVAPTLTFEQGFTVDLGGREVQVMHIGRANTGGDAFVYLPKEKILVTGDIVVHPVPYAFDGYPTEWARVLDAMANLGAVTIVPGHGEVLHDASYLKFLAELMRSVVAQIHAQLQKNQEATLDDVKKAIDLSAFRQKIDGGEPANAGFFDVSAGGRLIELAYHEQKQR